MEPGIRCQEGLYHKGEERVNQTDGGPGAEETTGGGKKKGGRGPSLKKRSVLAI